MEITKQCPQCEGRIKPSSKKLVKRHGLDFCKETCAVEWTEEQEDNCVGWMACPVCGQSKEFKIEVHTTRRFDRHGETMDSDEGGNEWNDGSYCECVNCSYSATVKDFQVEEESDGPTVDTETP